MWLEMMKSPSYPPFIFFSFFWGNVFRPPVTFFYILIVFFINTTEVPKMTDFSGCISDTIVSQGFRLFY